MDISSDFEAQCPYCGEVVVLRVETLQGDYSTIEDCTVCCRPIQFVVICEGGEVVGVETSPA